MRIRLWLTAFFVVTAALHAQSPAPSTWTVGSSLTGPYAPMFTSIQTAIGAAANGDVILVYPGTYLENLDLLGKNVTIVSAQGAQATVIDGGQVNAVVRCTSGEPRSAVLDGFTIRNGRTTYGGGFLILNSQPFIRRCRVVANAAFTAGGGVYCSNAAPRFENCDFTSNTAFNFGGGAASDAGGVPEYFECTFSGNVANYGGGIGNNLGDPVVNRCTISSNVASQGGGGVDSFGGQVRMFDSIVEQNTAPIGGGWRDQNANSLAAQVQFIDNVATSFGGALTIYSGSMTIENGLFTGNSAPYGGAVFDFASNMTIRSSTMTANNGTTGGGAVSFVAGGQARIENSILYGDTPNEIYAASAGTPYAATIRYSDVQGGHAGPGNIDVDPAFVNAVGLDFHLTATSPCRDAGAAWLGVVPPVDFEGECRFLDGALDMGADEFYPRLAGSADDLRLQVFVAGRYGPASPKWAPPNVLAVVKMESLTGIFATEVPVLVGQFFTFSGIPVGVNAYPEVHLDPQAATIIWTGIGAAQGQDFIFGYGAAHLQAQIPVGLGGVALRLQLFAVSPIAQNGFFGASDAIDLVF